MRSSRIRSFAILSTIVCTAIPFPAAAGKKTSTNPAKAPAAPAASRSAVAPAKKRENPIPKIAFEKYTLSNGLTVILSEDHRVPIAAINVNYKVGSKNERPGRTGFAHLFEHILFQGSEHFDDDFFKALQGIGGQINGGTNTDRTRYWEVVPSNYLSRALWLEADRMGWLLPALDQKKLSNQIDVVKNERRQNYDNRPYGTVNEKLAALVYPPEHPYHWLTIGSMEDLTAASLDDVRTFFRNYYGPNNATLVVVGDFDSVEARKLVKKFFGDIPPGPPVSKIERWIPKVEGTRRLEMQDRVQLPRLVLAWPAPPRFDADEAALDTFAEILGGDKASRLYASLVHDRQIVQDVSVGNRATQIAGLFVVTATLRPGHTLVEVESAVREEIGKVLASGVTAAELDAVLASRSSSAVSSLESAGGFGGRADQLGDYEHFLGDPDRFQWDLQRYLDLDIPRVNSAATRWIGGDPAAVIEVSPMGKPAAETAGAASEEERKKMPEAMREARAPVLPDAERRTLANGLQILVVPYDALPVAEVELVVPAGLAADPADRPGLASLTGAMLQEGTTRLDGLALAAEKKRLGVELQVDTNVDSTIFHLSSLTARLSESLDLLADVAQHPAFLDADLDRIRKRRITQILQQKDEAETIASKTISRSLYGDHPYGHPLLGSEEFLKGVKVPELRSFHESHFVPNRATLVIVGKVTADQAEALAKKSLGEWKSLEAVAPSLPVPQGPAKRTVYLVDRPGAAQSVVAVSWIGLARKSPDYYVSLLMNRVLGGFFMSRINLNLREDKGWTYGARSGYSYRRAAGPFAARAPVDTKNTIPALRELLKEIEQARGSRPFTSEEVEYARGNLVLSYAGSFEKPSDISGALSELVVQELPASTLVDYVPSLQKVSLDDVNAFARANLDGDHAAIVIVGDVKSFREELEKLDLGRIVMCDEEGRPSGK